MLNKNSMLAASPIVEDFAKRNLTILPIPGTPMQAVCSTMAPGEVMPENIEDLQQLGAEVMTINVTESRPYQPTNAELASDVGADYPPEEVVVGEKQVNIHDEALSAAIGDMAGKMQFAIDQARTTVLPQCRLLFTELQERIDDLVYAPRLVPTVVMSNYPDFYTSPMFIAQFGEDPATVVEVDRSFTQNQNFALIPGDYLRGALVTGNTELDVLIAQAAEGVTDAALEEIYNHFFRGSMLNIIKPGQGFLAGDDKGVGFTTNRSAAAPALFVWAWSRTLRDDVQEGNKMSLDNYEAAMMRAERVAANGMARVYKERLQNIQNGELILQAPSLYMIRTAEDASDLQIFVNADTYLDYLRNGGSPEALTGAVLLERVDMSKETLLGHNDMLMAQYKEFVELKATQQSANRLRSYALALKGLFNDKIIPSIGDNEGKAEAMTVAVDQIVSNLNDGDLANLQQFFRRLYVNITVAQGATTLNRLIDEIDIEMRANGDLTVFEAATKAMVNLLSDFVAQQCYVLEV